MKHSYAVSALLLSVLLALPVRSGEFDAVGKPVSICPLNIFDKGALVFGVVMVCGTRRVSRKKLRHAARVTAQWIDNNQDGEPDDENVMDSLAKSGPLLMMTYDKPPPDRVWDNLDEADEPLLPQGLYQVETDPGDGGRDASQEEVHHLIQEAGWSRAYPGTFGRTKSKLRRIWKKAERKGYYAYDDPTCDDECRVVEFLYKAMAVYHDAKSDFAADDEIRIESRSDLKAKLPAFMKLVKSSNYVYQKWMWPDGKYKHQSKNIKYYGKAKRWKRAR